MTSSHGYGVRPVPRVYRAIQTPVGSQQRSTAPLDYIYTYMYLLLHASRTLSHSLLPQLTHTPPSLNHGALRLKSSEWTELNNFPYAHCLLCPEWIRPCMEAGAGTLPRVQISSESINPSQVPSCCPPNFPIL